MRAGGPAPARIGAPFFAANRAGGWESGRGRAGAGMWGAPSRSRFRATSLGAVYLIAFSALASVHAAYVGSACFGAAREPGRQPIDAAWAICSNASLTLLGVLIATVLERTARGRPCERAPA